MTYEQAKRMLDADREAIEETLSDIQTIKGLYAIGEPDLAVNLFASVRHTLINRLGRNYEQATAPVQIADEDEMEYLRRTR